MWSLRYKPAKDPKRLTFGVGRQVGTDLGPQAPGEGTEKKEKVHNEPQKFLRVHSCSQNQGLAGTPSALLSTGAVVSPDPEPSTPPPPWRTPGATLCSLNSTEEGKKKPPTRFEGSGKGPEEENLLGSPSPRRSPHLRCRARRLCRDPRAQVGSPREPQTSLPGPAPPEATFHRYKIKSNHSKDSGLGTKEAIPMETRLARRC